MTKVTFDLHATDGKARTGQINTPRGEIRTPAFMPVGTAATVKAMMPESVRSTGADILLGNTYHLMLRPTAERIERLGGLAQVHELGTPDFDGQWWVSGDEFGRIAQTDRAGRNFQIPRGWVQPRDHARAIYGNSAHAGIRHRDVL